VPVKRGFATSKIWKIAPAEKTSQIGDIFSPLLREITSGATYPGVPHL